MGWALNLQHDATVTVGRGVVEVRQPDGSLVIYRPPPFAALTIGRLTTYGRKLELRSQ